jgi:hypothetical protein
MPNPSKFSLMALVCVALAVPGSALAWYAYNRHEVLPVSEGVFEVVGRPGSGAVDYWCAAGDFSISQVRTKANQRVYVWKAIGPSVNRPGKKAVQFAYGPPEGGDTSDSYSVSVKRPGENMSASFAKQYCYGSKFDEFDRWRF